MKNYFPSLSLLSLCLFLSQYFLSGSAFAAINPSIGPSISLTDRQTATAGNVETAPLSERLEVIRNQIIRVETGLLNSTGTQEHAREQLKKIRLLLSLQGKEKELASKRLHELTVFLYELEGRRDFLNKRINAQSEKMRKNLKNINKILSYTPKSLTLPKEEILNFPIRRTLSKLIKNSLKEVETLKVDLQDADDLETHINDEKQHIVYLLQDIKEQESLLGLHRQLQLDLIRKKHNERLSHLKSYRRLKNAENQVEKLIYDFNARKELEEIQLTEQIASKAMRDNIFPNQKGKLSLPLQGKILASFGRNFDPETNLHIFKKGLDIKPEKALDEVKTIFTGKVIYAGVLPNYGHITIVDHGSKYYSLYAHLGDTLKKEGDAVKTGDTIGLSDNAGGPVYFEIRSKNIALNPTPWIK